MQLKTSSCSEKWFSNQSPAKNWNFFPLQSNLIAWIKLYFKCLSVNGVTGDFDLILMKNERWGGGGGSDRGGGEK